MDEHVNPWEEPGDPVSVAAQETNLFVSQHVAPLLYRNPEPPAPSRDSVVEDESEFWTKATLKMLSLVHLNAFIVTDFFPRAPGVYWKPLAKEARDSAYLIPQTEDPHLGKYRLPVNKQALVEEGGLGTIRLRPKTVNGTSYWFATAIKEKSCDAGIPLAIPEDMLLERGLPWGHAVNITGRLRYLQNAGLEDVGAAVHGVRPLLLFVETLDYATPGTPEKTVKIRPTILFDGPGFGEFYRTGPGYIYVTCNSIEQELNDAADWMLRYAEKFSGKVLTNFDEQMPQLADAPLSYQKLVARTYDTRVINMYGGEVVAAQVATLTVHGGMRVNKTKVTAGGNAIVNVDSTLTNVRQNTGNSSLSDEQQSKLNELVTALNAELIKLKSTHPVEAKRIENRVQEVVEDAEKPAADRRPFLEHSAKGLLETVKLVANVAPAVVLAASHLGTFLAGLL